MPSHEHDVIISAAPGACCVCVAHPDTVLLLLSGNKRDEIGTSTQCTEWSQFALDYFFDYLTKSQNYSPSKRNYAKIVTWQMDV